MKQLGMKEGFDVALEMSGSPKAMTDLLPAMFHGGKLRCSGSCRQAQRLIGTSLSSAHSRSRESTDGKCTRPGPE